MSDLRHVRNIRREDKAMYQQPRERWPDEPFHRRYPWQVCEDCGYRPAAALINGRWQCGDRECAGKRMDRVRPSESRRHATALEERRRRAMERLKGEINASD